MVFHESTVNNTLGFKIHDASLTLTEEELTVISTAGILEIKYKKFSLEKCWISIRGQKTVSKKALAFLLQFPASNLC